MPNEKCPNCGKTHECDYGRTKISGYSRVLGENARLEVNRTGSIDMCFYIFGSNEKIPPSASEDPLFINIHYHELERLRNAISEWLEEHKNLPEHCKR